MSFIIMAMIFSFHLTQSKGSGKLKTDFSSKHELFVLYLSETKTKVKFAFGSKHKLAETKPHPSSNLGDRGSYVTFRNRPILLCHDKREGGGNADVTCPSPPNQSNVMCMP